MDYLTKKSLQSIILWPIFCVLEFQVYCKVFDHQLQNETGVPTPSPLPSPSSYYFQVEGDVYGTGYFYARVYVGDSPIKEFFLDIDTGSDLTWISCYPNNVKLLKPVNLYETAHEPYVTNNNLASCEDDTLCGLVNNPDPQCSAQHQQCDYQIEYADRGTSLGVLVKDTISLAAVSASTLIFGCGYHQEFPASTYPLFADGVLALGNGKTSFLSQLNDQGLIYKVLALCLSKHGTGYLVFGDSESSTEGVTWMPILQYEQKNIVGPGNLFYDGQKLGSGMLFVLDSGTTYNYFTSQTYQAVLSWLNELAKNVATPTEEDDYLPVCWKPLTSSTDVLNYFSSLRFIITDNAYFELEAEDYLVVSPLDNVCLGILDGQELEGFEDLNIIGDISMLDKLVIYDYENQMIGWVAKDCMQLRKQHPSRAIGHAKHHLGKKIKANRNARKGIAHRHKKMNEKKRKEELPSPGNM